MSRIYFHSPSRTVEVQGAERHHVGGIVRRLFVGLLACEDLGLGDDPVLNLIPPDCYAANGKNVELYLGGHGDLIIGGKEISLLDAAVNTAIVSGSLPIVFAARLHAQCEVHAFVEGPDRAWLAGIIEKGVEQKILRIQPDDEEWDRGWNRVIPFLRARDDEPVVTSFSVYRRFPNPCAGLAQDARTDEEDEEKFHELPKSEQWEYGMAAIRKVNGLQWRPSDFADTYFGAGWNAFSIRDYAERTFPRKDGMWDLAGAVK